MENWRNSNLSEDAKKTLSRGKKKGAFFSRGKKTKKTLSRGKKD